MKAKTEVACQGSSFCVHYQDITCPPTIKTDQFVQSWTCVDVSTTVFSDFCTELQNIQTDEQVRSRLAKLSLCTSDRRGLTSYIIFNPERGRRFQIDSWSINWIWHWDAHKWNWLMHEWLWNMCLTMHISLWEWKYISCDSVLLSKCTSLDGCLGKIINLETGCWKNCSVSLAVSSRKPSIAATPPPPPQQKK